MKILFLTDNFPPESNAPAIRTFEHTREWVKAGHEVTVVTCAPNFPRGVVYEGYRNRIFEREDIDGIQVVRVWSYIAANEGSARRIMDYASFMMSALLASMFLTRPDVVIATSPQFFTALGGYLVSKLKRRPFVFELRDLWPETILAVGAMRRTRILNLLERLAVFLYRRADLMVPVTEAFSRHLQRQGVASSRIRVITNGIEPGQYVPQRGREEVRKHYGLPEEAFVAGYIGTLGLCHGLSAVLDAAETTRRDAGIHYVLMGDGADRAMLEKVIADRRLTNVTILEGRPRQDALELLSAVDVSLVLLRNSPLFETVIPSKIFEAMELKRPIVLGVRGESFDIVVNRARAGLAFPPEDAESLVAVLRKLQADPGLCRELGERGSQAVTHDFRRRVLASEMLRAVEEAVEPRAEVASQ